MVGGGLAGLSAAHTVLEHGGRVLLLDKSAFCGGNSSAPPAPAPPSTPWPPPVSPRPSSPASAAGASPSPPGDARGDTWRPPARGPGPAPRARRTPASPPAGRARGRGSSPRGSPAQGRVTSGFRGCGRCLWTRSAPVSALRSFAPVPGRPRGDLPALRFETSMNSSMSLPNGLLPAGRARPRPGPARPGGPSGGWPAPAATTAAADGPPAARRGSLPSSLPFPTGRSVGWRRTQRNAPRRPGADTRLLAATPPQPRRPPGSTGR